MFECVAFSSIPDKSTVPSRSASAYREINPDAANWVIKSNCVVVCVCFFFFLISASLSYQRMLRHWTALYPGVVVIFRPI